jgi:hypothetical protein
MPLAMKKFTVVCLWVAGCYLASYLLLIKKVSGDVQNPGDNDGKLFQNPVFEIPKFKIQVIMMEKMICIR